MIFVMEFSWFFENVIYKKLWSIRFSINYQWSCSDDSKNFLKKTIWNQVILPEHIFDTNWLCLVLMLEWPITRSIASLNRLIYLWVQYSYISCFLVPQNLASLAVPQDRARPSRPPTDSDRSRRSSRQGAPSNGGDIPKRATSGLVSGNK